LEFRFIKAKLKFGEKQDEEQVKVMENMEILPQKVVDRKTVILKSRLDFDKARLIGENKKTNLFPKFGFLKPRSDDISLVGLTKYYEPFIVIGGKYSVDYCKKHTFEIEADKHMQKVFLCGEEFQLEPLSAGKPSRVLRLVGEEHSHYESETYFVLDRLMREAQPETVALAPFGNEMENLDNSDIDLRKAQISLEEEINFLRSKIVKRPSDAEAIIKEVFEITERLTIYNPIYELSFQNVKDAKEVTVLIDGITGKLTIAKFTKVVEKVEQNEKIDTKNFMNIKTKFFEEKPKKEAFIGTSISNGPSENSSQDKPLDASISNQPSDNSSQDKTLEKEISPPPIASLVSEAESKFEVENAIALAADSLKRLGLKNKMKPLKVSLDGEFYVVELSLQNKTAKVSVNTKTKKVNEYEIQELNPSY
jgi:hypothetical protein